MTATHEIPATMSYIEITEPGGPDVLKVTTGTLPTPAADEVLVKVKAAGINRPDVMQRQGLYPMPPGVTPIPGLEIAGTVVALGANVDQFAVGDRVCALTNGGGYAEYCVAPQSQTLLIPGEMDFVTAAAIPETFFTVWANLFEMGQAEKGDTVLIHGGTSGIGTTALMLCREFGIKAFATAGSDEKCNAIAELGGIPINYKTEEFAKVIAEKTDGQGVNAILDIIGGAYFEQNLQALARDGRLVTIGFLGGTKAEAVDLIMITLKRAVITGSTMRARTTQEKAEIADALRSKVWPILEEGRCQPIIDATFPLADASKAHELMEASSHVGKIVLTV